jgi:hypothetical protein
MRFFDGVELLEPGVVSCSLWLPDHSEIGIPVVVLRFSGWGENNDALRPNRYLEHAHLFERGSPRVTHYPG